MQLSERIFTNTIVFAGNDNSTLPDFPAEIRVSAGTLFEVSKLEIQFSTQDIYKPGGQADVQTDYNTNSVEIKAFVKELTSNLMYMKKIGLIVQCKLNWPLWAIFRIYLLRLVCFEIVIKRFTMIFFYRQNSNGIRENGKANVKYLLNSGDIWIVK